MRFPVALIVASILLTAAPRSAAQVVPDGFVVDLLVASGFLAPVDFAFLPDGRVLFAERETAEIKLWVPSLGPTLSVVGVVPSVDSSGERGLLSLCVDPGFATNGRIYVWSSRSPGPALRLARFELQGDLSAATSSNLSMIPGSERILLDGIADQSPIHNGGTVRFGPDGKLYLSIGDDAVPCDAQLRSNASGTLLRLNVANVPTGGGTTSIPVMVPSDNPFTFSSTPIERLVVAWGLRNPFTFTVDPVTGDLFIGDVGDSSREELDRWPRNSQGVPPGLNFGWPWKEGTLAGPTTCGSMPFGLTDPIDERVYFEDGFVIIAAACYRNLGAPGDWGPDYERDVFHGDHFAGTLKRLSYDVGAGTWLPAPPVPGQPTTEHWGSGFGGVVRFQQGQDGSLYFLDLVEGHLGRIRLDYATPEVTTLSGAGQVGVRGKRFLDPVSFQVLDPQGQPLAGETVFVSTSPNAVVVGGDALVSDANGTVSATIQATGYGQIGVTATLLNGGDSATATVFARGLRINHLATASLDILICEFENTTYGTNPVPFVFAAAQASLPTSTTIYGTLGVDLLGLVDTVVIEDAFGLWGGIEIQGSSGDPSATNVYEIPQGIIEGSIRFQAIWVDDSTPTSVEGVAETSIAFSNIVTVNF